MPATGEQVGRFMDDIYDHLPVENDDVPWLRQISRKLADGQAKVRSGPFPPPRRTASLRWHPDGPNALDRAETREPGLPDLVGCLFQES